MSLATVCLTAALQGPLAPTSPEPGAGLRLAALDPREDALVLAPRPIESRFDTLPLVEPHLSAHPANAEHLLVAAMVITDVTQPYRSARLTSFVSEDSGETWTETVHDWWGYDPWTAILESGETRMSWIGNEGAFRDRYPIRFFRSTDGGKSWSSERQTLAGNHDGTKLVAHGSDIWFTTVRFRGDHGADVELHRARGEEAFAASGRIDGGGRRLNFCEPAVLSDGTVLVPASDFLRRLWVQRLDPGASTLAPPVDVSRRPGGARGYMRLVADAHPDSPHRDRVYFVRAMENAGGVWLNTSSDRGTTWSPDTRIDLFAGRAPSRALVASAAVNEDGVLGVSWVDSQEDPEQRETDVYFALSRDGGTSFQHPVRITRTSSSPRTEANDDVANRFPGGGHYMGLAACADGAFQLVWADSRSGVFQLRTCRVEIDAGV